MGTDEKDEVKRPFIPQKKPSAPKKPEPPAKPDAPSEGKVKARDEMPDVNQFSWSKW